VLITAIDPGTRESAFVVLDETGGVQKHGKITNETLLRLLPEHLKGVRGAHLVIEQIAMGGMIAGREVFETAFWSGRFCEAWGGPFTRYTRYAIKKHVCGKSTGIRDKHIRAALVKRYGPDEKTAIGNKRAPGPLFGITADQWQALAVGVVYLDKQDISSAAQISHAQPAGGAR
jgi:hypothetical protein